MTADREWLSVSSSYPLSYLPRDHKKPQNQECDSGYACECELSGKCDSGYFSGEYDNGYEDETDFSGPA